MIFFVAIIITMANWELNKLKDCVGSCHCVTRLGLRAGHGKRNFARFPVVMWPSQWPGGASDRPVHRMTLLLSPVSHATGPGTLEKLSWEPWHGEACPSSCQSLTSYCSLNFVLKIGLENWTISVRLERFWLANEESLIPQVAHHKKKWMTPVCSASRAAQKFIII